MLCIFILYVSILTHAPPSPPFLTFGARHSHGCGRLYACSPPGGTQCPPFTVHVLVINTHYYYYYSRIEYKTFFQLREGIFAVAIIEHFHCLLYDLSPQSRNTAKSVGREALIATLAVLKMFYMEFGRSGTGEGSLGERKKRVGEDWARSGW
jgi:hypothetical protein